jgi:N-acetylmuramic acid 6-phosphate etherase
MGSDVIAESMRMKAGMAQRMVLNMLSTGGLVVLGKTYGGLMVDVQATNENLQARAVRIVVDVTRPTDRRAQKVLDTCDGAVTTAIIVASAEFLL